MATPTLPSTQSALVQTTYAQPLEVLQIPVPEAVPGSAVVKILSTNVVNYAKEVYNGKRQYPYTTPIVPGSGAVGRIVSLGPDSTSLQLGQLVHVDPTIHSRDDPDHAIVLGIVGGMTAGGQKLMRDVWRNGTWAEYTRVPLEVVFPLNEEKLLGELGYKMSDLATLTRYLVPYGGLKDIGVQAGDTVVVAPATGGFGSAGVACALAMGAQVIAMGRTEARLKALVDTFGERVKTVKITERVEDDVEALQKAAGGPVDAVLEISPPEAAKSTIIKGCITALKRGGRMSFMGGIQEDVAIPIPLITNKDLALKGKCMYGREEILSLIKMVESGILKIGAQGGVKLKGEYAFEEWEKALDVAFDNAGWDAFVAFKP